MNFRRFFSHGFALVVGLGIVGTLMGFLAASSAAADWQAVVKAARAEGKVVVYGPHGSNIRDALTLSFRKAYPDIPLEFSGQQGGRLATKLLTERKGGKYIPDIVVIGTTTQYYIRTAGAIDPIRPFLVGPDIQEGKWMGGKFDFADEASTHNLTFVANSQFPVAYNPDIIDAKEIRSGKDLLHPKWKGKITMRTPRLPGSGLALTIFWYSNPSFGKEFIDALFDQVAVFSRKDRQLVDWVAQGRYPIAIGVGLIAVTELMRKGVPITFFNKRNIKEGGYQSAGQGSVSVVNRAPHPNAAKVYLNWLLSKAGQTVWSKTTNNVSRRLDVPKDHLPDFILPVEGVNYPLLHKSKYLEVRNQVQGYIKEKLKDR